MVGRDASSSSGWRIAGSPTEAAPPFVSMSLAMQKDCRQTTLIVPCPRPWEQWKLPGSAAATSGSVGLAETSESRFLIFSLHSIYTHNFPNAECRNDKGMRSNGDNSD